MLNSFISFLVTATNCVFLSSVHSTPVIIPADWTAPTFGKKHELQDPYPTVKRTLQLKLVSVLHLFITTRHFNMTTFN